MKSGVSVVETWHGRSMTTTWSAYEELAEWILRLLYPLTFPHTARTWLIMAFSYRLDLSP